MFCPKEQISFTDSDLTEGYGSLTNPSILGSGSVTSESRDNRGLLTESSLKTIVGNLQQQGIIPSLIIAKDDNEGEKVQAFMTKDAAFIRNVKTEYCFYDARYKYALQQLVNKLQLGYTSNNNGNEQLIQKYLKITQQLNQKLNDLSQISNEITKVRLQQTQTQNTDINALNAQLTERSKKLVVQNEILNSQQSSASLYKDMVRYTKEKADATNNLLSLYSFLNVVALSLLVYVYRSSNTT